MKKLLDELVQKVKSQAGSQMTNYSSIQDFSSLPEIDFTSYSRAGFAAGGKNKVPKKVGYVANAYTGESLMGNMGKNKNMRGGYNKGGYASVKDMEKACASKTVKNTMSEKRG
jgi:hypothetical protein